MPCAVVFICYILIGLLFHCAGVAHLLISTSLLLRPNSLTYTTPYKYVLFL